MGSAQVGTAMIAQWIAQALLKGQDHLILNAEQLASWQANGCKVSLGAPYGLHGPYMVRQIWQWRQELEHQLVDTNPLQWPVGVLEITSHGNRRIVVMPALEFQSCASDMWRVPLIPSDSNHCLESWSFDLTVTDEELQALQRLAFHLARRMLLRCEIKGAQNAHGKTILWNQSRLKLASYAGFSQRQLELWFSQKSTSLLTIGNIDNIEFQNACT